MMKDPVSKQKKKNIRFLISSLVFESKDVDLKIDGMQQAILIIKDEPCTCVDGNLYVFGA